jgi:hypothetical protein
LTTGAGAGVGAGAGAGAGVGVVHTGMILAFAIALLIAVFTAAVVQVAQVTVFTGFDCVWRSIAKTASALT